MNLPLTGWRLFLALAMAHEIAGLEYGDGFDELAED